MFDIYCPRHGARVILFTDNIRAVTNDEDTVEVAWQCSCGERGTRRFSHARVAA